MRVLFIGDIVGGPGRRAVAELLPRLVDQHRVDLVIANCENAAGGFGATPEICDQLFKVGVDVLTSGNHIWDKKEIYPYLNSQERLLRPINYPPGAPGRGELVLTAPGGERVAVLNVIGLIFMDHTDDPFRAAQAAVERFRAETPVIIVDMHAEATSEKMAMGWFLDGKVSAVVGTHTHVPTADERILPGGTGYLTDIGMTGPFDSIIGMRQEEALEKFLTLLPRRFEVAAGNVRLNSVLLDLDGETGRCRAIQRVSLPLPGR
ncbi:MAG: TIGR00282 family metallophosphoesterase [Deltaproteobacteria bacterium]|nr:TIGR00282 family metallophosphoesterase [Deltaproteobacteria bacterium]